LKDGNVIQHSDFRMIRAIGSFDSQSAETVVLSQYPSRSFRLTGEFTRLGSNAEHSFPMEVRPGRVGIPSERVMTLEMGIPLAMWLAKFTI
jgi:hypothetical protein